MKKFLELLKKLLQNRYGIDTLSSDLTWIILLLSILSIFVWNNILRWVSLFLMFVVIYRMFSKKFPKRYNENRIYTNQRYKIEKKVKKYQRRIKDLRNYKYFTCPNCKLKLRVPRGKKEIVITCNRCKTQFDGKT